MSTPTSGSDKPRPDDQPEASSVKQDDTHETPPATGGVDVAEDASAARSDRSRSMLREIASGDALAGVLAVFLAVFVGSVMIAATDQGVRDTLSYITARPSDFFSALWDAVSGAYTAMFRGAVYNNLVADPAQQWRPLTERHARAPCSVRSPPATPCPACSRSSWPSSSAR